LWGQRLQQNLVQKTKNFATYVTIHTSLLIFVVNNRDQFLINSEIHNINTRQNSNLHLLLANLDIYQKGASFSGIKSFNIPPFNIKIFSICPSPSVKETSYFRENPNENIPTTMYTQPTP